MGLNLSKLRAKMKKMDENMGNSDTSWYKPKGERNIVRLLPSKNSDDDFYKEVLIHYNLNMIGLEDKQLNCLYTDPSNDSCPLCETIDLLNESSDSKDNDVAKRIKPTSRFYLNVCFNSKNDADDDNFDEVMVWNCPQSVFRQMLDFITDPDYIDDDGNSIILDPEEGYDFVVRVKGKGRNTKYEVGVRPKSSGVHIKDWESKLNDLSNFGKTLSAKEMYKKIDGGGEDDSDEEDSEDEEKEQSKTKPSSRKVHHHEEDEEEDKPLKKKGTHSSRKPSDDEDEDSEDEEDDSDDLEREIKAQAKKASRGHRAKIHHHEEEEDDDDGEDEDEDDLPF